MIKLKSLIVEDVIAHGSGGYYYRVHPKGDIRNVIKNGLYSFHPSEGPGAYIDAPDMNTWADDSINYRFYIADSEWEVASDRIPIRIPESNLEDYNIEKDDLGDYYIDTGNDSKKILNPNQYDVKIGNKWIRADMVDPIMIKTWIKGYYKKPGFYKNKFYDDTEEETEN